MSIKTNKELEETLKHVANLILNGTDAGFINIECKGRDILTGSIKYEITHHSNPSRIITLTLNTNV